MADQTYGIGCFDQLAIVRSSGVQNAMPLCPELARASCVHRIVGDLERFGLEDGDAIFASSLKRTKQLGFSLLSQNVNESVKFPLPIGTYCHDVDASQSRMSIHGVEELILSRPRNVLGRLDQFIISQAQSIDHERT